MRMLLFESLDVARSDNRRLFLADAVLGSILLNQNSTSVAIDLVKQHTARRRLSNRRRDPPEE